MPAQPNLASAEPGPRAAHSAHLTDRGWTGSCARSFSGPWCQTTGIAVTKHLLTGTNCLVAREKEGKAAHQPYSAFLHLSHSGAGDPPCSGEALSPLGNHPEHILQQASPPGPHTCHPGSPPPAAPQPHPGPTTAPPGSQVAAAPETRGERWPRAGSPGPPRLGEPEALRFRQRFPGGSNTQSGRERADRRPRGAARARGRVAWPTRTCGARSPGGSELPLSPRLTASSCLSPSFMGAQLPESWVLCAMRGLHFNAC